MLCDIDPERRVMRRQAFDRHDLTVTTRLATTEHDWLHASVYRHADNRSPRFRMPDLLSACVSLAIGQASDGAELLNRLVGDIARRPLSACRSCDIWQPQFELLMRAHRAAWNEFPHPKFELDQLTTACVAIVRAGADLSAGDAAVAVRVLGQARCNYLLRMRPACDPQGSSS